MTINSLRGHNGNINIQKTENGFWRDCIILTKACRCRTTSFISVEHRISFQWHRISLSVQYRFMSQKYSNMNSIMWYVFNIFVLFDTSYSPLFPQWTNIRIYKVILFKGGLLLCYVIFTWSSGIVCPDWCWKDCRNSLIPEEMYVQASRGNIAEHGCY